jgi:quinol-cytochrome oxidoreductase complex cytochrome b subunit
VPSVERAYQSVKDLEFVISFGWFLRGLHRVSAHLMVAVVFLHLG